MIDRKFADMSDDEMAAYVIHELTRLKDNDTIPSAVSADFELMGAVRAQHVGNDKDMTRREVLEWYAGQLVDIVSHQAWAVMVTYLDRADEFVK